MISLTNRAVDYISGVRASEGRQGQYLRLRVLAGGCSGFSYDLGWDDREPTSKDEVRTFDDVMVVVDKISLGLVEATEIDYESGLYGAGFVFRNPQSEATCGCGQSFTA